MTLSADSANDAATIPLTELSGVGPALSARLARLNLHTLQDLLFHLPLRYQDRSRVVPLSQLRPGDEVLIEAELLQTEVIGRQRRMLICHLGDGSGGLQLRLFHFSQGQIKQLQPGRRLRCYGEVKIAGAQLEMVHPEYRLLTPRGAGLEESITPVYPATEGLGQQQLRRLMAQALAWLQRHGDHGLRDWLPDALKSSLGLPSLQQALLQLHAPPLDTPVFRLLARDLPARRRLVVEELLAHHLALTRLRVQSRNQTAPPLLDSQLCEHFIAALPFALTGAQQRVIAELRADLRCPRPMLRLVQGDVGSGKTVVAAAAALLAVEAGYQVALMAPTELLAEQHYQNFQQWLTPLGVEVGYLSGRLRVKARREMQQRLAEGLALVVGTHALFQESVEFAHLGLLIIDEQHRFGVHQRLALRQKGVQENQLYPHQLVMTATPIPRTLAMTAYADLDSSVIDELPPGRTPVTTVAISESRRDEVVSRVAQACSEGRQVYWVCTLIDESELLNCQAAEETALYLTDQLPECTVGLIHGRMKAADKEVVMAAFKRGELQLLVATTVIEVGVDVPNASLMIIENAERLGLSQLHQLRGRVGRGSAVSSCVLLYHPPLGATARERLAVMRASNDGFVIAEEDLRLRGPGEVLGTRQTGLVDFSIADLQQDAELLPLIKRLAARLREDYPDAIEPLVSRWIRAADDYGAV